MSTIDEIKARIDIVDLVSETVKLRRTGKNYTGFCPFHDNKRTPAFAVFSESGTWRCFGACNEGGDIFGFVMKKEGWDFSQALHYLAERAGVPLEPLTPEKIEKDERVDKLQGLLEKAVIFYQHQLLNTPSGKEALDYLHGRGIKTNTIELFGLGYAPNAWDAAAKYFLGNGYSSADLLEAGLVTERDDESGIYDRFRHRILFPIRDVHGRMTGFGGRVLNPEDVPKYLNSPQTSLFDKGQLLFGLNLARKSIREKDQVILVEGYLDVIVPYQEGFTNIVSSMGTALSSEQLRALRKLTSHIVMALDPDEAGEKATLRGLELARESLDRSFDPVSDDHGIFNARKFIKFETRLNADIRVATLPENQDPDEIVLADAQKFSDIIRNAKAVVIHVMDTLIAQKDISDPKVKDEITKFMLPLIEDVPSGVERNDYTQRLARLMRIDERTLLTLRPARESKRSTRKKSQEVIKTAPVQTGFTGTSRLPKELEKHILRLLLRDPETIYYINNFLAGKELTLFTRQDFEHTDYQSIFTLVHDSLEQIDMDFQDYIARYLTPELQPDYEILLSPMPEGEPNAEAIRQDMIRSLLRLRQLRANDSIEQHRTLLEMTREEGDGQITPINERILQDIQLLNKLNQAINRSFQTD